MQVSYAFAVSSDQDSRTTPRRSRRTPGGYAAGQATRVRLIEAAETLFAERGIAGVSLNEVRVAAGQNNAAAVNYYFGAKENLVRAILEHRLAQIEADRAELLDALDAEGRTDDVHALLVALVHPQVNSIERDERYVGFAAQLVVSGSGSPGDYLFLLADPELTPVGQRIDRLLHAQLAHLPTPIARRRLLFAYGSALQALARHQRHRDTGTAPPTPLFVAELIDMLSALLTAPVSEETITQFEHRTVR